MKHITFDEDGFPTGVSEGNPLPEAHSYSGLDAIDMMRRLRFADGKVKDISKHSGSFFINKVGNKHIKKNHEDWQELQCEWDDEVIHDGDTWLRKPLHNHLSEIVSRGKREIDLLADSVYTQSVSRGQIYRNKREQAAAYKDAGSPTPADASAYPYLVKEASKKGISEDKLAESILLRAEAFEELGPSIEEFRAQLEVVVMQVTSIEEANGLADGIVSEVKSFIEQALEE